VRLRRLVLFAVAALAAGVAGAAIGAHSGESTPGPAPVAAGVPQPVAPAFTPGRPEPLRASPYQSSWAPVRVAATARSAPDARARVVARVDTTTPEDTTNIVVVLGRRADPSGRLWVKVRLAALPNSRTGWLPRSDLGGYGSVETRLVVDLRRLTATLLRRGRPIFRARVGVGQPQWPTPRGEFYVRNRLTKFAGPTYGPLAFGTSARSTHLTDWPDGGFIGIHGTDEPQLIPGRVSHGCIRMRNADILKLARLMPIGTPLTIA
jgi:lipoprotein-anchoring transpeptidase ErfK/SrfK